MALASAMVFEFRTGGNANNGGGFKTGAGGTDYSQQDAAQKSASDLAIHASDNTKVQPVAAGVAAADVGNVVRISAGTGFTTGWYEITAQDGTYWTLDRAAGTTGSTGGTYRMGGAISTLQDAFFETLEPGNKCWFKSGTFSTTETLSVAKDGTTTAYIELEGYNTTRGDAPTGTNRPLISGDNFLIFDDYWMFKHIRRSTTTGNAWLADQHGTWVNCNSQTSDTQAFGGSGFVNNQKLIDCYAKTTGNSQTLLGTNVTWLAFGCFFETSGTSSTCGKFQSASFCVFKGFSEAISTVASGAIISHCTIYGASTPSGVGINIASASGVILSGNIISNLTTGVTASSALLTNFGQYNNFYNNTTDRTNFPTGSTDIDTDPSFTDSANGDFSVGTSMKAASFPGALDGQTSTGYLDMGAVQREEPAGGGGASAHTFIGG